MEELRNEYPRPQFMRKEWKMGFPIWARKLAGDYRSFCISEPSKWNRN